MAMAGVIITAGPAGKAMLLLMWLSLVKKAKLLLPVYLFLSGIGKINVKFL